MALPQLTDEQRRAALKKATEVREKRAKLSKDLKSGKLTVVSVLGRADDPVVGRMKVSRLLASLPGLGKVRSQQIMSDLGIDQSRRIAGLGSRQKEALTQKLS